MSQCTPTICTDDTMHPTICTGDTMHPQYMHAVYYYSYRSINITSPVYYYSYRSINITSPVYYYSYRSINITSPVDYYSYRSINITSPVYYYSYITNIFNKEAGRPISYNVYSQIEAIEELPLAYGPEYKE